MIVRDATGRLVVAIARDHTADAARELERLRWQMLHRGLIVPVWLDELLVDARLAAIASMSDTGHLVAAAEPTGSGWITTAVAARVAGVTDRTVRRWCTSGRLPDSKQLPDGTWLVPERAIRQEVA